MTRLIGTTWKRSNALSEGVLIARFLLGNLEIIPVKSLCDHGVRKKESLKRHTFICMSQTP